MSKKYYTYILFDPQTNIPFYVGKGITNRMYYHKQAAIGNYKDATKPHHDKIREIISSGYDITYEKVLVNGSETQALNKERQLIEFYGRQNIGTGPLLNLSRGGENGGVVEKPVIQYNMSGVLIQEFPSVKIASEQTGANRSYISQVCKGKHKSAGGWLWIYKGNPTPTYTHQYHTPVRQMDKNKNHIQDFKSLTEAQDVTGITRHNISECCRKKSKSAGGFRWEYL